MLEQAFMPRQVLADSRRVATAELAPGAAALLLFLLGAAVASLVTLVDLRLRIPGHTIIQIVFPMTLGLALAPRRAAGTTMVAGALAADVGFMSVGTGMGPGPTTSMLVTGLLMDLILGRVKRGPWIYGGLALAATLGNLAAFSVRAFMKASGADGPLRRPLWEWLPQATVTYAVSGLVAGLLSAAVFFHFRGRPRAPKP